MHILHVTEYCHIDTIGGTERYILDLIQELGTAAFRNSIVWLAPGTANDVLEAGGIQVFRLPTPQMRVDSPLPGFHETAALLLDAEMPDWLHFHTFGLTEAALAVLARQRGIRCAFTYHSSAWTCRRETMSLYGQEQCDGEVRAWRCSACQAQQRLRMPPAAGHVATAASMALGWLALPLGRSSIRRRTAFYYDSARFSRNIRNFLSQCDLVVSCCDWSRPVLGINGARAESILHCPQGVPSAQAATLCNGAESRPANTGSEFVVAFVGRIAEIKGVHILMEGFSQIDAPDLRLRIVGWDPNLTQMPYARRLHQLAQSDSRIELVPKRSFTETLDEYRIMSLLAIPSIWVETGPLTLLEAISLGVPVYGSNRLGQLDLLREHGRVVEPNTATNWQAVLTEALKEFRDGEWAVRRERIRSRLRMRSMSDVAHEMACAYQHGTTNT